MGIYAYSCIGVDEQTVEDARREIETAGYRVAHWFADQAATGLVSRASAQQFTAMMRQIDAGDTLVVTKLHLLGCNAEDLLTTIKTLAARQVEIVVLELGKINLASDAGSLMLKMLNALVEMQKNQPAALPHPQSEPVRTKSKTDGRAAKLTREQRAKIITEYSQGVGVTELAHRYKVSRSRILGIVAPKQKVGEPLPFAWGD